MVAPAHMNAEDAVDRLLAALPESDAAGRARFAELSFPTVGTNSLRSLSPA